MSDFCHGQKNYTNRWESKDMLNFIREERKLFYYPVQYQLRYMGVSSGPS